MPAVFLRNVQRPPQESGRAQKAREYVSESFYREIFGDCGEAERGQDDRTGPGV